MGLLRGKKGNMLQLSWKLGSYIKEVSFYASIDTFTLRYTLLDAVRNMALSEYMGFSFDLIKPPFVSLPAAEV